jgi:hypothetical protein
MSPLADCPKNHPAPYLAALLSTPQSVLLSLILAYRAHRIPRPLSSMLIGAPPPDPCKGRTSGRRCQRTPHERAHSICESAARVVAKRQTARAEGDARSHVLVHQERREEQQRDADGQHHANYSQQQHSLVSLVHVPRRQVQRLCVGGRQRTAKKWDVRTGVCTDQGRRPYVHGTRPATYSAIAWQQGRSDRNGARPGTRGWRREWRGP